MTRGRHIITALAVAGSSVCLTLALIAPPARRIEIVWSSNAAVADRVAAEDALQLRAAERKDLRTWTYEMPTTLGNAIIRVIRHPLVEDVPNVDRARLRLEPEPRIRARLRRVFEFEPLDSVSRWWFLIAPTLAGLALVLARPTLRLYLSPPGALVLPALIASALALRVLLVVSGGQFYWPDESRYQRSRDIVVGLAGLDAQAALAWLDSADHPLFKPIGAVPAAIEFVRGEDARIAAGFFALFSVFNIWLIVRIARRLGADRVESLLAGALLAGASSFFYYSRHLLPYDVAMTFGLLAIYSGCAPETSWRSSIACGSWAACAFLTYMGYWTIGGAACVIHVFGARSAGDGVRRAALAGVGLICPIALFLLGSAALKGQLLSDAVMFSRSVTQGSYDEGWWLPIEYLWHAEHFLLILWLAAVAWCGFTWRRWRSVRTVRTGLAGLAFVYGALGITSGGLHLFVVYGRTARPLVPFLCLVTAAAIAHGMTAGVFARKVVVVLASALLVQVALNFWPPLTQTFPAQFIRRAASVVDEAQVSRAVLLYAHHMHPPEEHSAPAGYRELIAARHPLQFRPYQYEGFHGNERRRLRSTDIRMRVLVPADRVPAR